VAIDYMDRMAIVGVTGREEPESKERIIAVVSYSRNLAEVAFTTHNKWQNRGIGTFLFKYLIQIAREHNIAGFAADVLSENTHMLRVFQNAGHVLETRLEYGAYELKLLFEKLPPHTT